MEIRVSKVWLCLVSVILLLAVLVDRSQSSYRLKKVSLPSDWKSMRIFTNDDIAKYDGKKAGVPIYMAIKGVVFDVSSGNEFYAEGKSYNALVGKDSTRAVAKMSLDEKDLNNDLTDLSDAQLKALDDIYDETYMTKYPVVGYMDYLIMEQIRKTEL